jgi:hypothetical protein
MAKKFVFDLSAVKRTISKHLYLKDDRVIDVILAAHVANRFDGDPLWMLLIAPSSSGKTELLRALDGHYSTYFLSSLTPSTLVSGMKRKKDGGDPSLLPKLNDKTVILKDFTTILSLRQEQRAEILSQLREVFDGHYTKCFGTGLEFDWHGKVGLIAASTPVYDRHYAVISSMGDRFIIFRSENGDALTCADAALRTTGYEESMRLDIQSSVHGFLDAVIENMATFEPKISSADTKILSNIAAFVGIGRCPVERDGFEKNVLYYPEPEGPGRITKQLFQLSMSLMIINGKEEFDKYIFDIIQKVGRDLLPVSRLRAIAYLWHEMAWETTNSTKMTSDVAEAIGLPTNTTKLLLEDLMVVGALNRQRQESTETAPYRWCLRKQICEYITHGGVFGAPF